MAEVTKQDLTDLKADLRSVINSAVEVIVTEIGIRFGEVNQRLDRLDSTLLFHGKQIAACTKAIAEFTELTGKAWRT